MPQPISETEPRTFSFTKSGWITRMIAAEVCLAVLAAVLIWFRILMPLLPRPTWIRYSLTTVGLVALYVISEFILRALVSGPICRWMEKHDQRVLSNCSGVEKQKQATESCSTSDVEPAYEQKRA